MKNRIWLELELSDDPNVNHERASKLNLILQKLGVNTAINKFEYNTDIGCYLWDETVGFEELVDNGKWLNLDVLAKDA